MNPESKRLIITFGSVFAGYWVVSQLFFLVRRGQRKKKSQDARRFQRRGPLRAEAEHVKPLARHPGLTVQPANPPEQIRDCIQAPRLSITHPTKWDNLGQD